MVICYLRPFLYRTQTFLDLCLTGHCAWTDQFGCLLALFFTLLVALGILEPLDEGPGSLVDLLAGRDCYLRPFLYRTQTFLDLCLTGPWRMD
jgi:hypothetical protein